MLKISQKMADFPAMENNQIPNLFADQWGYVISVRAAAILITKW